MVLPFLTLYLTVDRRLPASTAGLVITIYGISAIVIAPLAGRLSDRLGALRIMKTSLVLSGLVLLIFSFVHSLSGIFAVTAVWAITSEAFRHHSDGSCFECSNGRLDPSLCNGARRSFGWCRFRCVDFRQ
jgi:nitrate/nitrite transporter NarK